MTTTVTSRERNQDVARAKEGAARSGPVLIADRGEPAHVLSSIEDCRRPAGDRRSLADALSMTGLADIDPEPRRVRIESPPAERP